MAAAEMCSQKEILPLKGMTTTKPGSSLEVPDGTSDPRGRGSDRCLEGYGKEKTKVSGEGVVEA